MKIEPKHMKTIWTLVFLWLIALTSYGQKIASKNALTVSFGPSYIVRQDLVFSPFIHQDLSSTNIGIRYQRKNTFYQNLHLRFSSLKPSFKQSYEFIDDGEVKQTSPHIFNIIDLDYWLGKEISRREKYTTTVGIAFNTDIQALNYAYGRTSFFGYYSAIGLGAFISQTYIVNGKNKITGQIALPVFNWLARSPYLVNDDEFIENISSRSGIKTFFAFIGDGNFATLNKLQTLDFRLNYSYKLNDRWELGVDYLFEFIHSKEPRNLLSYRNSIFINNTFKF